MCFDHFFINGLSTIYTGMLRYKTITSNCPIQILNLNSMMNLVLKKFVHWCTSFLYAIVDASCSLSHWPSSHRFRCWSFEGLCCWLSASSRFCCFLCWLSRSPSVSSFRTSFGFLLQISAFALSATSFGGTFGCTLPCALALALAAFRWWDFSLSSCLKNKGVWRFLCHASFAASTSKCKDYKCSGALRHFVCSYQVIEDRVDRRSISVTECSHCLLHHLDANGFFGATSAPLCFVWLPSFRCHSLYELVRQFRRRSAR